MRTMAKVQTDTYPSPTLSPKVMAIRIAALPTPERQRLALRKALSLYPDDANLLRLQRHLTDGEHIRRAAANGIFISYTSQSELFALALAEDLQAAGLRPWLDITHIPEQADWHLEIERALQRYHLMLLVVSPDTFTNEDTRREVRTFLSSGKLVLPLLYERCEVEKLGLWLSPINFCHSYSQGLEQLTRLIKPQ
ncbi:MAG: toll/interleukin-1 receptor domain-containing protein [Chloroflexi bacterium]|nr:MAG: toll/interleukin-1 receptor domain-containing protein [Chloroflexota bacterium]